MPHDKGAVGYGHPPKEHRFRKGRSGNPNGRPPKVAPSEKRESEADILKRLYDETVVIEGREMTRLEVELRLLIQKGLKGDTSAMRLLAKKRQELGIEKPNYDGGVLVVPAPLDFDEWDARAAAQQAKFREERD